MKTKGQEIVEGYIGNFGNADAMARAIDRALADDREQLRDRFAMAALAGLMAFPGDESQSIREWAEKTYAFADAMLVARKVKR